MPWRKRPDDCQSLLHATNPVSKLAISVQIPWTPCNKTNNLQSCQHHPLIRILPEESQLLHIQGFGYPFVDGCLLREALLFRTGCVSARLSVLRLCRSVRQVDTRSTTSRLRFSASLVAA